MTGFLHAIATAASPALHSGALAWDAIGNPGQDR
jgi:hypothetical protein